MLIRSPRSFGSSKRPVAISTVAPEGESAAAEVRGECARQLFSAAHFQQTVFSKPSGRSAGVRRFGRSMVFGRQISVGDAVVPAQGIFVEKDPSVPHGKRNRREIGSQDSPAADRSGSRTAIETGEFQSGGDQARRGCRVGDQQIV